MPNTFESLKDAIKTYLTWAKIHPACAREFYAMARGCVTGAQMALLYADKSKEYEEIRSLWENELDPAFQALF